MKKITLFAVIILSVSACKQSDQQTAENPKDTIYTGKNSIKYTCPMHPEVVENKPGVCRKCGMELVEKE
ncbi:heavy metal-binding domain-containing protein [uncultured Mucilaginibacter sp.]|uniref:heavy metal-binding domain-containing protein n=1 Tax=uncultured Mucilaginibacter sp. TaxID=797541 RepID=UPI0026183DDB|nr:heavy metal-binding domain-containing protein [uncultured Mucilaginibacter sp.]